MPIYEYRCDSCGHELEALQKISDVPLTECPQCDSASLRRLISKPSFRLKGSGWYETDFKSDKEKKRNLVAGKEDGAKSSGDDKPAAKETKKPDKDKSTSGSKKDSGTAAA